ncbi:MAG TPA: hypothetical protein VHM70_21580 [Polyangiaceae bacterium]|nr:hypothetical protein [Polyangiaceae bacterium]
MAVRPLIDSIVRQTTVLIAQLATTGGLRAPLAHIANQIFLDLTGELEAQGVSRKVSADMFGMALRAYQKKIQRLSESSSVRGRSLWEAVLEFVTARQVTTRVETLQRFRYDDETLVKGVLHDLVESGLLSASGNAANSVYRATTEEERRALSGTGGGLQELLWALIYREGPLDESALAKRTGLDASALTLALGRLADDGRVRLSAEGCWTAPQFCIPLGSESGWEAAVFDHYHAVVKTLCSRLVQVHEGTRLTDDGGGSTYTFKVWDGHPWHDEVIGTLRAVREQLGALRAKVELHNQGRPRPERYKSVVTYVGQCVTDEQTGAEENL